MFAIALKQQQYQTYILSDETAQSRIEVVPERGAIITSWCIQGKEILYLDVERFTKPDLSVRGGIPILFPICGNLPQNTYTHGNREYTLKQHGFARDLPWAVTSQKIEPDRVSLTLTLNSCDRTRTVYPFDFELAFTYQLQGNSLELQQRYTNHSNEAMPFSTGLHPYFWTLDKTQLEFEIPASQYVEQNTKTAHPFRGDLDFSQSEIDIAFRPVNANSASIKDSARRLQLKLSYDNNYSALVFWTVKGKDFYCLEPWSAPRNALNTGENLIELPPEETLETWVRLEANFL